MKVRNADLLPARTGLQKLSEIGSKDKATVKRLAKMLRVIHNAGIEVDHAQMALIRGHAKRDDHGQVVVDEKGAPVFDNVVAYTLSVESLMYDATDVEDVTPFTVDDVERFNTYPDGHTLAMCGPFVTLD